MKLGLLLWNQDAAWSTVVDAAQRADRNGYDMLLMWDHLYSIAGDGVDPYRPIFEGWTSISALAALTEHVHLGLLVGSNPVRNPGLLAKMAVTLDHISNGRALVGLGAGWFELEHTAHGIEFGSGFGERLDWLDQSVGIIRRLIDGETVDHESAKYHFSGARHAPRPVQPHLPILVGGNGLKKTLRTVARYADLWNTMGPVDDVAHRDAVLREHCVAVGRDTNRIERTLEFKPLIRDDQAEAERVWAEVLANAGTTPPMIRNAWLGSPAQIVARMAPYRALGFDTMIAELPAPYDPETIERLATEVKPLAESL
ncbi:MAG TPA: LLM class flavin-dependent oxidoreductase [Candidatus Sulfotelmatobacter sp.]|nr:LLM class flavin-dependent oxidoreductase [Candidatus Sulfotelmatobacter sp.]